MFFLLHTKTPAMMSEDKTSALATAGRQKKERERERKERKCISPSTQHNGDRQHQINKSLLFFYFVVPIQHVLPFFYKQNKCVLLSIIVGTLERNFLPTKYSCKGENVADGVATLF